MWRKGKTEEDKDTVRKGKGRELKCSGGGEKRRLDGDIGKRSKWEHGGGEDYWR